MQSPQAPPLPPPPPPPHFSNSDSDSDYARYRVNPLQFQLPDSWDLPLPPPPPPFLFFSDEDSPRTDRNTSDSDSSWDVFNPPAPPPPPPPFLEGSPGTNHNTSDSSLPSCPICRDNLGAPDTTVRHLPCTHAFHLHCITPWLHNKNTCPVCRFKIPSNDLELLHSPSLAGSVLSPQQHLAMQAILTELPPPPPPLPLPQLTPLVRRWHQNASTLSPQPQTPVEDLIITRPSPPMPTTEDSARLPPTRPPPSPPATPGVDADTYSLSQRRTSRRFLKAPLAWSWWRSRCIGRF